MTVTALLDDPLWVIVIMVSENSSPSTNVVWSEEMETVPDWGGSTLTVTFAVAVFQFVESCGVKMIGTSWLPSVGKDCVGFT